ncbi:hypothetical protein PpBr36_07602 [Pyricularia pennisetigena]|nr:hypothetical protein PpBr36_07602 [Pyricularia pennisetigena]TLS25727.1 hypothetical protein PpBr36_07602 [Pyricularia pennisetigena]
MSDRFIGYEQGFAHAGIWSRLIHSLPSHHCQ